MAKGAKGPVVAPGAEAVDKAFDGKLAGVLETLGATGAEGEVTKLPAPAGLKAPLVLAVGLGDGPAKGDALRRRGAAPRGRRRRPRAGRHQEGRLRAAGRRTPSDVGAVARGRAARRVLLHGAYTATNGSQDGDKARPRSPRSRCSARKPRDKAHKAAAERAAAVAEEINRARDLINTPPNDLDPAMLRRDRRGPPARSTASRSRCWTRRR